MKKPSWKSILLGLPLLAALVLVWLLRFSNTEPLRFLLRELILALGYVAAAGDLRKKTVPNPLVLTMLAVWVLVMIPQLFLRTEEVIPQVLDGLFGALMAAVVFVTVYLLSRKGLGGGDVKFMVAAGLYLGLDGVIPTMLAGSVMAGAAGLTLILSKKLDRKGAIPLVPFLWVGVLLTVLFR